MVAGYGAWGSVAVNQETFEILLKGCHEAGALEKALEVLSWMHGTGLKPSQRIYSHLTDTVDIVTLWDNKVFASKKSHLRPRVTGAAPRTLIPAPTSLLHTAILPQNLRPAPHDGKRCLYMQNIGEQLQVRTALAHKTFLTLCSPVPCGVLATRYRKVGVSLQLHATSQRCIRCGVQFLYAGCHALIAMPWGEFVGAEYDGSSKRAPLGCLGHHSRFKFATPQSCHESGP
jgi:hypothetical protein